MVVYNVGDMKRRGSPAIKHGSSDSVTETGAQQGKSSSTVTIRQTEGNGQEKSSDRASAENVGKIERRSPPSFNGSSNSVDETGARRGKSSSTVTIRQTEGNSQEKSSGRASVEESGINNRTATELDGADTVFADGSISVLSEERKITPETNEEARYEILKDRTIRPANVEYDKLKDTDTAAIYDGLSAAQIAQAKKPSEPLRRSWD